MITAPEYNTNNAFIVKDEWRIGDPIPHNVKKIISAQYEPSKEDGDISQFDATIFIFDDAENILTEQEILQSLDQQYAPLATRVGQKCIYDKDW